MITRERADNGHWYEIDEHQGWISRCRMTHEQDSTTRQRFAYDPHCALCWLGYGHSAGYHRAELDGRTIG